MYGDNSRRIMKYLFAYMTSVISTFKGDNIKTETINSVIIIRQKISLRQKHLEKNVIAKS